MKALFLASLAVAGTFAADKDTVGPIMGRFTAKVTDEVKAACCVPTAINIVEAKKAKIVDLNANWTTTATDAKANKCTLLGLEGEPKGTPIPAVFTDRTKASYANFAPPTSDNDPTHFFKIKELVTKKTTKDDEDKDVVTDVKTTTGIKIEKNDDFKIASDWATKKQTVTWTAKFTLTSETTGEESTRANACDPYKVEFSKTTDIFCDKGKFIGESKCEDCPEHCKACKSKTECTQCEDSFGVSASNKVCHKCVDGEFLTNGKCVPCQGQCLKCSDANTCIECKDNQQLVKGKCKKCNDNQFFAEKKCNNCPDKCTKCTDAKTCQACEKGHGLKDNLCVACAANEYPAENKCTTCPAGCSACTDANTCSGCSDGYELKGSKCIKKGGFGVGWIILIIVIIAALAGAGYWYWTQQKAKKLNESLIANRE